MNYNNNRLQQTTKYEPRPAVHNSFVGAAAETRQSTAERGRNGPQGCRCSPGRGGPASGRGGGGAAPTCGAGGCSTFGPALGGCDGGTKAGSPPFSAFAIMSWTSEIAIDKPEPFASDGAADCLPGDRKSTRLNSSHGYI